MDGRYLNCTRCGARILVHELPGEYIDPLLYVGVVCGCRVPTVATVEPVDVQLALLGALEETRDYEPEMAAIPF